jgi:hypothetical protein
MSIIKLITFMQIHLPSKERKLKTIQPDNCERFEKTVAAVIAKLRENKDERVRSKNYKQFKTSKAWNDRLLELSVYLEIPKVYFGFSSKTQGVIWGPMIIHLEKSLGFKPIGTVQNWWSDSTS